MFDWKEKTSLQSSLTSFKQSIFFYPIIFSLGSLILFIITSRIDELFYKNIELDNPYIGSLIFSGDADASRNILSAISTGWATILGVAFSVTLITLQLSTSKYTSHLVNRFENDKINQLTLGWFIAVVLFSLLVLKTVRTGITGGGEGVQVDTFAPILGVNISILLAGSALFVFIAFLHNIASYLRPNMLISNIVEEIIDSLKPFKKRKEFIIKGRKNESQLFQLPDIDNNYNYKDNYNKESSTTNSILELRSNQKGICRSINWDSIYHILQEISKKQKNDNLWMQWYKTLGDQIEKNDVIALIYLYDTNNHLIIKNIHNNHDNIITNNNNKNNEDNKFQKLNNNNNNNNNDNNSSSMKESNNDKNIFEDNGKHKLNQKLMANITISNDRDIVKDPVYGIELVRSLAVKSANQSDTDVVGSCITGLFRILRRILSSTELLGIPFTLDNKSDSDGNDSNNSTNKNTDNSLSSSSSLSKSTSSHIPIKLTIINPKETKLRDSLLFELSMILEKSSSNNQVTVIKHFINEYISLGRHLLEINRTNEFCQITKWCANQVLTTMESFQKQFQGQIIIDLMKFNKELIISHPQVVSIYEYEMKIVLTEDIKKYVNISIGR